MYALWAVATLAVLIAMFWVGKEYGRHQQATFDRRYDKRLMETFVANMTRLEQAVAKAVEYINQAKAAQQSDAADQAKVDELASQIEAVLPPPA